jgi:DNA-binding CsgD family transcriptional regulator/tetratricopeptide (TPR) repeat protein
VAIKSEATLLERERELAELRRVLDEAQSGNGRAVLIEAPAGLGKTTLLSAAADHAGELGMAVLRARASDLERDFAYGCVRQLLDPLVGRLSDAERDRLFAGAAGMSSRLFEPVPPTAGSPDSAFAMLHGLYWLLNNVADDAPLALCVDDLHWADTESLRFLNFLAPRLDGLAVALLASARPGEQDADEVNRLAAAPEARVLRPPPLSAEATTRLCERRLGEDVSEEFAAACRDATGGNPFLLEALLVEAVGEEFPTGPAGARRVADIGPAAVARAIVLRLTTTPPTATALVRATAVLGDGATVTEAAELAELSVAEAARAADRLVALEILRPAERLEFAHPIVREAIYADIGARERAIAHARAADLLARTGAPEQRIAAQIAKAEPAGDVHRVELLRRVAADALGRGAPAAAVAWLRRALAEPPPPELQGNVLLELSSAELRLGAPEAAVEPLEAAAQLLAEPELLVTAVRLLAGALTWSGNADRAVAVIGHTIDTLEDSDRESALLLEAERAAYAQQGSLETRRPVWERLERYADLPGDTRAERLVLASLAFERSRAGETAAEASALIERAIASDRLLAEQDTDVTGTLYLLVLGLLSTDSLDLAASQLDAMLADARARGSIPAEAFVTAHRAWASLRRGSVARAEADAGMSLELLMEHDIPLGREFALAGLIGALIERGGLDEADLALRDAGYDGRIPPGMAINALLEARGMLRLAQGRAAEAVSDLSEFGKNDELFGAANPLASRWRSRAALAHLGLGDADAARRLADEDLTRARRWGAASGVGVALHALGLSEGGDAGIERLAEAATTLESSPARLAHARALTDLGAALRRANRRSAARRSLHDGLRVAESCGARALAERARTELRAAGGRSSDRYGSGVEQLTASEQRVAELAAQGLSNPEIAQTLFVTRKTIETHLGHVYAKLGISGRGELRLALAGSET